MNARYTLHDERLKGGLRHMTYYIRVAGLTFLHEQCMPSFRIGFVRFNALISAMFTRPTSKLYLFINLGGGL